MQQIDFGWLGWSKYFLVKYLSGCLVDVVEVVAGGQFMLCVCCVSVLFIKFLFFFQDREMFMSHSYFSFSLYIARIGDCYK